MLTQAGQALQDTVPSYAQMRLVDPVLSSSTVTQRPRVAQYGVVQVAGSLKLRVVLTPKPIDAALLRLVPARGVSVPIVLPMSATLYESGANGENVTVSAVNVVNPTGDAGLTGMALVPAPSRQDAAQAASLAGQAIRTLVTFPAAGGGDLATYARAQAPFYATAPANGRNFANADVTAAPTLSVIPGALGLTDPTAVGWGDLNAGQGFNIDSALSPCGGNSLHLQYLRPLAVTITHVAPQPAYTQTGGTPNGQSAYAQQINVAVRARLNIGTFICNVNFGGAPPGSERAASTLDFAVTLTRLASNPTSAWTITQVDASVPPQKFISSNGGNVTFYELG